MAGKGMAWNGKEIHGHTRKLKARHGKARKGMERQGLGIGLGLGMERKDKEMKGMERHGKA
jgi:hypothetical protein